MKGFVYIDTDKLGEVDFKVIDESMGAIGGNLISYPLYNDYRNKIQSLYNQKGISNISDFNFKIILIDNTLLQPVGGIGITDSAEFNEIYVEAAGLDVETIGKIKS